MKTKYKIAGGILLSFLFLYVILPFLIVGGPTPFYEIKNNDTVSHKITVEIFDPQNNSIHKKDYFLEPHEVLKKPKPPILVLKTYFIDKECGCRFESTLNNNSSASLLINYHPWNEPSISVSENKIHIEELSI
ncbi:hypothetical protein [Methanolobus bombayensis]|uniref:hypothetical protein n=1 Tax=Methanolobus bombayensis TaxID=38023 RepID=UPI001AE417E1|nr:hypothetical protein [Methanolobus bombayensis]MBP1908474.1 hypothetical protein [Methanolobus bombayensis]